MNCQVKLLTKISHLSIETGIHYFIFLIVYLGIDLEYIYYRVIVTMCVSYIIGC